MTGRRLSSYPRLWLRLRGQFLFERKAATIIMYIKISMEAAISNGSKRQ